MVGCHKGVLVVQETAHIAVKAKRSGFHVSKFIPKIGRKVNYAVDLALLHKGAGLNHIGTLVGHMDLARGIHLARVATAHGTIGLVYYSNGSIFQNTVDIDHVV